MASACIGFKFTQPSPQLIHLLCFSLSLSSAISSSRLIPLAIQSMRRRPSPALKIMGCGTLAVVFLFLIGMPELQCPVPAFGGRVPSAIHGCLQHRRRDILPLGSQQPARPSLPNGVDSRFDVEERHVPTGANPLHN